MLSSAIKKYADFYGVKSGEEIVLFTNNDTAYETALSLSNKGIKVKAIVDIRDANENRLINSIKDLNINIYNNHTVVDTKVIKELIKFL